MLRHLSLALVLAAGLVPHLLAATAAGADAMLGRPSLMPALGSGFAPARMSGALPDGLRTDTGRPVMGRQGGSVQATLETLQPDVQWSPAGAARWVSVPDRQAAG